MARIADFELGESLGQGNHGRPEEIGFELIDRARRVTQHAVDAHAVRLVLVQVFWRLEVLPFLERLLVLPHDPGLHALELAYKIGDIAHQVPHDGKAPQRLHPHWPRQDGRHISGAGENRLAVDQHPATTADTHAAGPAVGERSVHIVLDVVQRIQDHPLGAARHLEALPGRLILNLRTVALDLEHHRFHHETGSP